MRIKTLVSALALSLVFALPAQAEEVAPAAGASPYGEISGTVGFFSQYRWRGVTQTDENPAVQGSLDWAHDSGFYAGVWGSNVDFNDGSEASMEMDVYGGYQFEFGGLSTDVGLLGYLYPGADNSLDYDFMEAKVAVGYDFGGRADVTGSVYYSPEFFANSGDAIYTGLDASVPLMDTGVSLTGSVGHQWVDDNASYGYPNYTDWSAGLGYSWHGVDFSAKYIDTDMDNGDCADGCDAAGVFSVSKTLN